MNRIKHFGSANVSIVDTKTDKIISPNLVYWAKYADEKKATVVDETKFSFTIPTDLGAKCATAGDCVGFSCSLFNPISLSLYGHLKFFIQSCDLLEYFDS